MDGMVTPKRQRRVSMPAKFSGRRKSLFGQGIDSPDKSSESYSPTLASPVSWTSSPNKSPMKTPLKSLQAGFTKLNIEKTIDHPIGIITVQTTPKVKGVRELSPDRGVVTPKTFYGRSSAVDNNRDLYDSVKERVRRSIVFAPRANQPFLKKKRPRSLDFGIRSRPSKTPRLSPSSKPFKKVNKTKNESKKSVDKVVKTPKSEKKAVEKKIDKKVESKKQVKKTYNWQFFNTTTPPTTKKKKKNDSLLTPPSTSKKRKLISSFDMDHLRMNEESNSSKASDDINNKRSPVKNQPCIDLNKSATQVVVDEQFMSKAYGDNIADDIAEDFSEEENEIVPNVENILRELNSGVNELLDDVTREELMSGSENVTADNQNKLFPVFTTTHAVRPMDSSIVDGRNSNSLTRAGRDINQMILDVGQSNLREVVCSQCGLLYVKGDAVDELCHQKYHSQYRGLLFQGWKNQRITGINGLDKVVTVKHGDPKHWWNKAKDVLQIVDRELGFPENPSYDNIQVFMYVAKNKIIGCAVAKQVRYAHRVLPDLGYGTAICSEESYPVLVGISRIWVHPEHRRFGIASFLVDSIRKNYNFVKYLKIDEIAFSSPTEEGQRFAAKYCKRDDYLVYTYEY